jgi:hypothetical protein
MVGDYLKKIAHMDDVLKDIEAGRYLPKTKEVAPKGDGE